ncbi:MAG: type II toxin-antitoxin system VapC family toxin, partial [Blastocatellia bacterium]
IAEGFLRLEQITQERFGNAIKLRRKYSDKPRISFSDFASMVVMSELSITDVLTEDDHFLQVGMGFNKLP